VVDPGKETRWTEALKRANVEATIYAPKGGDNDNKRKWWNAKMVVTGLHNDGYDVSDEEDSDAEEEDSRNDDDSPAEEERLRRKQIARAEKGKMEFKLMESPILPSPN